MIMLPDEAERLIRDIEDSGSIDAVIAAFGLVEAGDEASLVEAWDEVEAVRLSLPARVLNDLTDLLLERLKRCGCTKWRGTILPSGMN